MESEPLSFLPDSSWRQKVSVIFPPKISLTTRQKTVIFTKALLPTFSFLEENKQIFQCKINFQ